MRFDKIELCVITHYLTLLTRMLELDYSFSYITQGTKFKAFLTSVIHFIPIIESSTPHTNQGIVCIRSLAI